MGHEKVVVIGAGPAGLAAAGQLKLYGIDPLVFECDEPGGLLLNACSVINYPGTPGGISGRKLAKLFSLPERIAFTEVTDLSRRNMLYHIESKAGVVAALAVVVASGTVPVRISVPGVAEDCIHYDVKNLLDNPGSSIAVIGGGDAALDYAMSLSSGFTVNVYARGDFSKVVPHLLDKVRKIRSIMLHPESLPKNSFSEDLVIAAVGRTARVDFISEKLLSSPPADGSFHMCGDCRNGMYRQTAIAVGNGVEAAMKTARYLKKTENGK
ncbi:MAG: NAD(P)/FAD-dependent oxidoreductase [Candidatus Sabulitectum sp.]|nr:NAD(P)/FAD-dependent oxidoreductase [Candidatus Sabulitectum sp.]